MSQETLQVIFLLDGQRYALYVRVVERVVRAVAITPLPKAPDIVLGVINLEGKLIPVLNIRKRFNLSDRPLRTSDQFVIARTASRQVALLVDNVANVKECDAGEIIPADNVLNGVSYISGIAKDEEGLVLIHDLDTFLSIEEESQLNNALES
jgi:purine-binding chemotaxis protein CheW